MIRLGYVSAILPEHNLRSLFEIAAEIGYDSVELMCWPPGKAERRYAGVCHLNVEEMGQAQIDEVKALEEEFTVSVSGLGYYPNPLSPDPEERSRTAGHLEKVIRAAAALGINQVNTFVGRDWTRTVEDNWPGFLTTWRPLIGLADQLDVKVGIENCPMLFSRDEWPGGKNLAYSPAIWRRMFADIPSPNFGLNYDPSHLIWLMIDPVRPIREFGSRIFHVHAKDARLDRHKLDEHGIFNPACHTPKLPGQGDVPWGAFIGALADAGFKGDVCVEVEDRAWEKTTEDRIRSLQVSHAFLRQFMA
jgi:sugar phosphate isomerase/epimerase